MKKFAKEKQKKKKMFAKKKIIVKKYPCEKMCQQKN